MVKYYGERSSMTGRFRVLHSLDGVGSGVISGLTVYEQGVDFPDFDEVVYQYPPYLFEAMMHLFPFYQNIIDLKDSRTMIPHKVGELRFSRVCQPGERLKIQARLRKDDAEARTWDAQATDQSGKVVIRATGMSHAVVCRIMFADQAGIACLALRMPALEIPGLPVEAAAIRLPEGQKAIQGWTPDGPGAREKLGRRPLGPVEFATMVRTGTRPPPVCESNTTCWAARS